MTQIKIEKMNEGDYKVTYKNWEFLVSKENYRYQGIGQKRNYWHAYEVLGNSQRPVQLIVRDTKNNCIEALKNMLSQIEQ